MVMTSMKLGDDLESVLKLARKGGGHVARAHKVEAVRKFHAGPIHSSVAGRTDHLPMTVASGSYVIPAESVAHLGQGNTMAGFKVIHRIFGGTPYGGGSAPYGQSGGPYGAPMGKADGGEASNDDEGVPIVAAGGEVVLTPDQVMQAGDGDLATGHQVLDAWVRRLAEDHIKTLQKLPGPAK